MSFRLVVLGSSGGPTDKHTSAYLIKSAKTPWYEKCVLAIDAGTLVGGIEDILAQQQQSATIPDKGIFPPLPLHYDTPIHPAARAHEHAWYVFSQYVTAVYLTHPHLDHLAGLVINSAGISASDPIRLAGLSSTLDAVRKHVFNGVIWPNLTNEGWNASGSISLEWLKPATEAPANSDLAVEPFPVSHGSCSESTAYLIKERHSGSHILVWGDVEPDTVSENPRNRAVWSRAAGLISQGLLSAIMIECSYPQTHKGPLYGHMTPRNVIEELKTLAEFLEEENKSPTTKIECPIIITHVKEKGISHPSVSRDFVQGDLNELATQANLECNFIMAYHGLSIEL